MNKSKLGSALLVVGGVALVAGVGTYLYQQYLLTDYLCYGTKGFKVLKAGIDSTTVELNLTIENKATLDIELKKMSMDIYANNVFIAKINQDVSTSIQPLQTTKLPITISFNPKAVLGSFVNIVTSSPLKDIAFRFKGKVTVKKFGLPIPIPFDFSYTANEMMQPSGTSVCDKTESTT